MPPPNRFWVILIGKTATSFKAKERPDLLPTYKQLQRTQSEVSLRWFERGRIWESPDAAEAAAKLEVTEGRTRRPKEWRPGGEHRDPKARYELTRDQKRAKFKRRLIEDSMAPASPFGPRAPRESDGERPEAPKFRGPSARTSGPRSSDARPPRSGPTDRPRGGARSFPMENPFKKSESGGEKGGGGFKPPKRRS